MLRISICLIQLVISGFYFFSSFRENLSLTSSPKFRAFSLMSAPSDCAFPSVSLLLSSVALPYAYFPSPTTLSFISLERPFKSAIVLPPLSLFIDLPSG